VNRTVDNKSDDRYASWSPDGRQIAFWSDRDGGGYYVMPSLGGAAQKITATPGSSWYHSPPAWSTDGTQLAVTVYKSVENRFDLVAQIISLANRDVRQFPLPGSQEGRLDLSWSPDGRFLAYLDVSTQSAETSQLRILNLADGSSKAVTDERMNTRGPSWSSDGRYIYFVSNRGHTSDLWRQRIQADGLPAGDPVQVTTAVDMRHAAFSKDGKRLVYSKGRWLSNLWRVPILQNRAATWADAQQMTFDQAFSEFVDISPDGKMMAFSSDRAGNQDIWTMPVAGGPASQLTADPAPEWDPSWSPDGRELAFYAYRTSDREIWKMPSSGGPAIQLTRNKVLDAGPDWSPDGREIIFRSLRNGNSDIWAIPANGGEARQITSGSKPDICSTFSPDGRWIAFTSLRTGEFHVWRVAASGGEPELLSRGPGGCPQWSRDGKLIIFGGVGERAGNFWAYSLVDRTERPVTNLTGRRGELILQPPSTDEKYLYFPWRDDLGDIWVMDVVSN
jgi:Tol biopolymer transport system component